MSKKIIYILALIVVLLLGSFLFIQNKNSQKIAQDKAAVEKIKIAYPTNPAVLVSIIGAREGGFFTKYNLDIEGTQVIRTADALTSGSTDVAMSTGIFPFLAAAAKGHNIVWTATLTNNFSSYMTSHVSKEKIQKVGTTTLGSSNYYQALDGIRTLGLDPEKITIIPLVDDKGITAAFDRGNIDAVVRGGPAWENYKATHPGSDVLAYDLSTSSAALLNAILLVAKGDVVEKRPDVLSNLTAALLEGTLYAKQNPKVIEDKLVKDYQVLAKDAPNIVKGYLSTLKAIKVVPDASTAKIAAQLMKKDVAELGNYDTAKFVNTSIAGNALTKVDFNTIKAELAK